MKYDVQIRGRRSHCHKKWDKRITDIGCQMDGWSNERKLSVPHVSSALKGMNCFEFEQFQILFFIFFKKLSVRPVSYALEGMDYFEFEKF